MFTTIEQVQEITGYDVDQQVILLAQTMIEVLVGRNEGEVENPHDLEQLARATALQAAYIGDSKSLLLEQAPLKSIVANESTTVFDTEAFAPFYSMYAVLVCRKLSWMGSRSVHTGTILGRPNYHYGWRYN